jgi:hypothetical protein
VDALLAHESKAEQDQAHSWELPTGMVESGWEVSGLQLGPTLLKRLERPKDHANSFHLKPAAKKFLQLCQRPMNERHRDRSLAHR